jgi:hypothetical protein
MQDECQEKYIKNQQVKLMEYFDCINIDKFCANLAKHTGK